MWLNVTQIVSQCLSKDTSMWHMMGLNPMTQDWLGVDTIFGDDVIMKY
jgi:hypothetical protein